MHGVRVAPARVRARCVCGGGGACGAGVADCGGGIGRVVAGLLAPMFDAVDLVEPNERFLDTARRTLDPTKLRNTFTTTIQV